MSTAQLNTVCVFVSWGVETNTYMFSYTNLIPKVAFVKTANVTAVAESSFSELVAMYLSDCSNDVMLCIIHVFR